MNRWRLSSRSRLLPRKRSAPLRLERLEDRTVPSIDLLANVPGTSGTNTNSNAGTTNPAAATGLTGIVAQTFHTVNPQYGPGQSPAGYWPSQIRHAYGFDQLSLDGTEQTIAIVDAYGDPNLAKDLAAFDTQFNLAAPPSFKQVSQTGGADSTVPTDPSGGWEVEESLDVEWAHAIAPKASILLVEANSANLNDLLSAVSYATSQPNVEVVSMSWGGSEFGGQSSYDSYFTTPTGHKGITFVAASGDNGTPAGWPASSPNVLAVGGTSLGLDTSDNRTSESGWSYSGGGYSSVYGTPTYQQTYANSSYVQNTLNNRVLQAGSRGNPDVSYNADSSPGYAVYDTFPYQGTSYTWFSVGGTSAGSPQWAALVALADQQRGASGSLDGPTQTLPDLYKLAASATSYGNDFFDVTSGYNGYSAQPGYDLVSGLGSPQANNLILDLAGSSSTGTTPTITSSSPSGTVSGPVSSITFTFNEGMNPNSFSLSDVTSFTGPGGTPLAAPTSYSWLASNTELQVNFASQTAPGSYSMVLGPNISDPNGNQLTQSYTASYTIAAAVTPTVTSSSPSGTVNGPVSSVTFTFNEGMNPNSFALSDITSFTGPGGTALAPPTSFGWLASNTELQVNFASQTAPGSYSMVLGTNVSDPNGTKLAQPYTASYTIAAPNVLPVIVSSSPTGTVKGPVGAITFTFNEAMNPSSFALSDVQGFSEPSGSLLSQLTGYTWLANNTQLEVDFTPQTAAGTYGMMLGPNISDPNGNQLPATYGTSFTIQASTTPTIVSSTPTGTVSGPVGAITFTFNEAMNPSSFALSDVQGFGGPSGSLLSQLTGYSWLANNTELQVDFKSQTAAGTYGMTLGPNISDLNGNRLTQSYTDTFTIQGASSTQTFSSTDVPAPVVGGYMTISTLNVPVGLDISKLTVKLNINYPYTGDLAIDLYSPSGTDVALSYFEGGRGANFKSTVFDDAATTPIYLGHAPFTGSYRPETALSAVNGQNAQGTWYLVVSDYGYRVGSLTSWSLTIQGSASPALAGNDPSTGLGLTPGLTPLVRTGAQPSADIVASSAVSDAAAGTDTNLTAGSVSTTPPAGPAPGLDNGTAVMIVHALTASTGTTVITVGNPQLLGASGATANILTTGSLARAGSATALSSSGQTGFDQDEDQGGMMPDQFDLPPMADPALASSAILSGGQTDTPAEAGPTAAVCDAVFADEQGLAFLGDREAPADVAAVSSFGEGGPSGAVVLALALGGFWRGDVPEVQQPSEGRRRVRI